MLAWRFACGLFIPGIVAAAVGSLGDDPDPRHAAKAAGQYISGTVLGGFSGRFIAGVNEPRQQVFIRKVHARHLRSQTA